MAGSTDQNGDSYLTRPFRRIAYPGLWSCARGSGGESYQNTEKSTRVQSIYITATRSLGLKSRISGKDATTVAREALKRRPIPLLPSEGVEQPPSALVPSEGLEQERKTPRVRKHS